MAEADKKQEKLKMSWKWTYQIAAFLAALATIYAGLRSCLSDGPPPPTPTLTNTSVPTLTNAPVPTLTSTITPTPANTETPTPTSTITPTPTPFLMWVKLTSPVKRGDDAQAVVQTATGETCTISYITPLGNESISEDLDPVVADVNGMCAWKWHISAQTEPGEGKVVVRVGYQELERPIVVVE